MRLAALAHYKLVYIHPFVDGNGRTSRLLMNLVLMQVAITSFSNNENLSLSSSKGFLDLVHIAIKVAETSLFNLF